MHRLWISLVSIFLVPAALGQSAAPAAPADGATRLPVRRVILYKNGVGYFEHSGRVRGNEEVNINFTTAQLNDVLKSLTVIDTGQGRITGVSYNSNAPLERRLGALRLPVGENPTAMQFLDALRGARVEVRSGTASAIGRLLSVDERDIPIKGDQKIVVNVISLITDAGEVRTFDLTPATTVRIADKDVNDDVSKYMKLIASTRDQDIRRMAIATAGTAKRDDHAADPRGHTGGSKSSGRNGDRHRELVCSNGWARQ